MVTLFIKPVEYALGGLEETARGVIGVFSPAFHDYLVLPPISRGNINYKLLRRDKRVPEG